MFNFQISIVSTIVSTFNFRRPAARESGNSQFSRKLAKLEKLAKLAIFRPVSFFGNQSKMDQKLRVLRVFPVLRVSPKIASFRILGPLAGRRKLNVEMSDSLFGNWTCLELVEIEIRNVSLWMRKIAYFQRRSRVFVVTYWLLIGEHMIYHENSQKSP